MNQKQSITKFFPMEAPKIIMMLIEWIIFDSLKDARIDLIDSQLLIKSLISFVIFAFFSGEQERKKLIVPLSTGNDYEVMMSGWHKESELLHSTFEKRIIEKKELVTQEPREDLEEKERNKRTLLQIGSERRY